MILYICSKESDYLQDLTYAGLCDVLGKEKVWDFPRHWQYHSEKQFFWSREAEYPASLGFVPSEQLCSVSSPSELAEALKKNDFKLAVLASAKPDALQTFQDLFDHIRCPWVFVDGGDWPEVGGDFKRTGGEASFRIFKDLCRKRAPALVFKRELPLESRDPLVFPFPFSFKSSLLPVMSQFAPRPSESLPGTSPWFPSRLQREPPLQNAGLEENHDITAVPKNMDVLFWAVESSATRKKAFQILKGKYDCESNGSVPGQKFRKYGLRGEKYFEALASAKIALSFRGEGFDTLRYWEIPACGSFMISEVPPILIPGNFVDGKHAVFCKPDLSDLTDKIDYFLKNEKEREDIARAGRAHLLKCHTHRARAEYFIGKVKERLGPDLRR